MAVTSGFFNSLYGDRKYTAEQFSALFNGLINDGVFSNIGTAFRVSATTDNNITIGIGRAWFNGIWVNNDALLPMTCNDPEVLLDRIDAVVIEINRSEAVRAGRIIFVKGTASGTPVNPTLTHDESVDQYPLAYIRRKAGVSAVVQADITNCIGTSACPYVTGILETQNIDSIVAQWESQFNIWFDGLQVELEGDVAANLASQVIDLNMRFVELAETRTVTTNLQDSSLDTIEDSTGSAILGSTVLGESEGSETNIVPTQTEESFKVGDMLTTVRTDLGFTWLLCNGAIVSRDEYPGLYPLLSENTAYTGYTLDEHDDFNSFDKIVYGNGYYVAVGSNRFGQSGSYEYGGYYYSTSLNGPWTWVGVFYKSAVDTSSNGHTYLHDIIYANGYFVCCGSKLTSGTDDRSDGVIVYFTSPTSSPSYYSLYSPSGPSDYTDIKRIVYINNQFVAIGRDTYPVVSFTSNITSSSAWTTYNLATRSNHRYIYPLDIIYNDGVYTILFNYNSSGIGLCTSRSTELADFDLLSGYTTWFSSYIGGGSNLSPNLLYADNKYVSICMGEKTESERAVYVLTGINGSTKTEVCVATRYSNILYTSSGLFMFAALCNDEWRVYKSKDPEGPWDYGVIDEIMGSDSACCTVWEENGNKIIIGLNGDNSFGKTPFILYSETDKFSLPITSVNGQGYTFIKAKE